MTEYIEKDAAKKALGDAHFKNYMGLPSADVVEVIRCKDCRFFTPMMYEALISHLRECAKYDKAENTFEEAADTIEYLSSYFEYYCPHYIQNVHDGDDKSLCAFWGCDVKSLPRWIPVTERLPMIGKKAVCFGKNGYMIGTYGEFGWMFPCYFGNVTHWMPLPKPPEEE